MTCVEWFIASVVLEVACVPLVLLMGRAMWQNGDGSREQESEQS